MRGARAALRRRLRRRHTGPCFAMAWNSWRLVDPGSLPLTLRIETASTRAVAFGNSSGWHHADDGRRLAIEAHQPSDDVRIGREALLPEGV